MKTNSLAAAAALSDLDLLARVNQLARSEREATAELVAHLAALELRPSLYAAEGYGSLFAYCTEVLRLSEDAACNRIDAARACRDFPIILDLLTSGSLTLTSVRMLRKHLTPENHEVVLARAANQRKERIEALVAELAPKPDVVSSVRKLPIPTVNCAPDSPAPAAALPLEIVPATDADDSRRGDRSCPPPVFHPDPRPVVQPLAPERYRVQFTIGQEAYERLRRVQALLRREIPSGDAGVIFERFIDVLLEKVEKDKLGKHGKAKAGPRAGRRSADAGQPAGGTYENRIRSGTDRTASIEIANRVVHGAASIDIANRAVRRSGASRHIPNAVRRAVWYRDAGQCAFVARTGKRCTERTFLELHHIQPYALDGPATVGNISLRCRRHNQYEAELAFCEASLKAVRPAVESPT
jgi:hypothetical protein